MEAALMEVELKLAAIEYQLSDLQVGDHTNSYILVYESYTSPELKTEERDLQTEKHDLQTKENLLLQLQLLAAQASAVNSLPVKEPPRDELEKTLLSGWLILLSPLRYLLDLSQPSTTRPSNSIQIPPTSKTFGALSPDKRYGQQQSFTSTFRSEEEKECSTSSSSQASEPLRKRGRSAFGKKILS